MFIIKNLKAVIYGSVFTATLGMGFARADDVLKKEQAADNYCHMKLHALRPTTLATEQPEVKRSGGDLIDFYGPCAETETSMEQITQQRRDEQFRFGRAYEDGD